MRDGTGASYLGGWGARDQPQNYLVKNKLSIFLLKKSIACVKGSPWLVL